MISNSEQLKQWIAHMALSLENDEDPDIEQYTYFLEEPELALQLVALIDSLDEQAEDEGRAYYSACMFALDVCVAQLQAASEVGHKMATKILHEVMGSLASAIARREHSLSFWLPMLNAFYEVHAELTDSLKNAYLDLASEEDDLTPDEELSHLNSIRDLIEELSDLSVFDIAENFFAQSYAMPADFFADLVMDLYSIDEGYEIALLMLLHPNQEVRDVVVAVHEELMDKITLSSVSLTRLQAIKQWYPAVYHEQFNRWMKQQRKKGVVFQHIPGTRPFRLKASEIDGSGAEGIFLHLKKNRKNRLCGLLLKQGVGIKDAWITPAMSLKEIARYYDDAFDGTVTLRDVDIAYIETIVGHFLAVTIARGSMPGLHLLEIQEEIGSHFLPQLLDVNSVMDELAIQVSPFTEENMQTSLARSKQWPKNKRFTESWIIENSEVDRLVNRCCSFVDGVKVCRFEDAMHAVFTEEMERHRGEWLFHFLWITLWLKAKERKGEKIGQDSFFIAHAIRSGIPLDEIPIFREICKHSVVNSIETMEDRRTHLN